VGFLRRFVGGSARGTAEARRSSPDWAAALRPRDFEYLAWLVQKELGRSRIPDVEMLRDFANAAELSLVNLLPLLEKIPTDKWPQFIHAFFEDGRARRAAGDAVEARAQTFEAATEVMRIHWMRKSGAPAGDVTIDGPVPDVVEVLALDAGDSMRHVSERLFSRWGVTVDEAVRVARDRVLACPVVRTDLSAQGHPAVRVISLEHEGPWGGALLTGLDRLDPSAIGVFGTLVGAPVENALVYRALDVSDGLRADLSHLSVFTYRFAEDQKEHGFLKFPLWRERDGRTRPVAFRFSDAGELLDSHDPGFAGVLAALDPQELLPVPGWAQGILSEHAYTRFAGCVSAVRGVRPSEIGELGSALVLQPLARQCRAVGVDEWPTLVEAHLAPIQADLDAANAMLWDAGQDRDTRRDHLVTWLQLANDPQEGLVTRPLGETGFIEVLGFHASGSAVPVPPAAAANLGALGDLFELGSEAIHRALVVEPAGLELLSGEASWVTGLPSPTAAIPHLMRWLPDAVGPYGALVAVGDASRLVVLPIHDASAVLDLPALLGMAASASVHAAWRIAPTVFWLGPDRLDAIHVVMTDGVVTAATTTADLAALVARLPAAPRRLPAGLPDILGPEGSRRFYGLLHAAIVQRLADDPAGLSGLTRFVVRDLAGSVRDLPVADWATAIDAWMDEMAAPRRELDRLTLATDYAEVLPSLGLRVARTALTGSELARDIGGGLATYLTIDAGPRHRRVTFAMLERWRVDADRCFADAASNTAGDPALIDEPMYADQPAVRQLYSRTAEREAAGLCLHLRHPGTRRGFVVSITHGTRAHYVRLDDPGAVTTIPVFANIIAGIYREADKAADAHSPWLFWLRPNGQAVELFNILEPMPRIERLPTEFVAMLGVGGPARQN
jgi:hypothetical protein